MELVQLMISCSFLFPGLSGRAEQKPHTHRWGPVRTTFGKECCETLLL